MQGWLKVCRPATVSATRGLLGYRIPVRAKLAALSVLPAQDCCRQTARRALEMHRWRQLHRTNVCAMRGTSRILESGIARSAVLPAAAAQTEVFLAVLPASLTPVYPALHRVPAFVILITSRIQTQAIARCVQTPARRAPTRNRNHALVANKMQFFGAQHRQSASVFSVFFSSPAAASPAVPSASVVPTTVKPVVLPVSPTPPSTHPPPPSASATLATSPTLTPLTAQSVPKAVCAAVDWTHAGAAEMGWCA